MHRYQSIVMPCTLNTQLKNQISQDYWSFSTPYPHLEVISIVNFIINILKFYT